MTRSITIVPVLNGYVAEVACQRLAFTSKSHLLSELGRYLDAPEQVEKEYRRGALNRFEERQQLQEAGMSLANPPQCTSAEQAPPMKEPRH